MHRNRRMHDQRVGTDRDIDDRREILADVIGSGLVGRDGERKAAGRVEQRVPVWWSADDRLAADHAGRARPILHNELLIPPLAEFLRQHSRHHIDAAAGGDRNDDAHGPIGVIGPRRPRARDCDKHTQSEDEETHRHYDRPPSAIPSDQTSSTQVKGAFAGGRYGRPSHSLTFSSDWVCGLLGPVRNIHRRQGFSPPGVLAYPSPPMRIPEAPLGDLPLLSATPTSGGARTTLLAP